MGKGKNPKMNALLLIGALCVILALTADALGLGASNIFGWKQWLLLIVGLVMIWMSRKHCKDAPDKDRPPSSNQV